MSNSIEKQAIDAMFTEVRRLLRYRSEDYIQAIEALPGGGYGFSVRYFGDWINPLEEQDEEDYDWQIPTDATARKADQICADIAKRFPSIVPQWVNEGEKNWMGFQVRAK